jgi:hypothetical protein
MTSPHSCPWTKTPCSNKRCREHGCQSIGSVDMVCHKRPRTFCPDNWECCNSTDEEKIKHLKKMLFWLTQNPAFLEVAVAPKNDEERNLMEDIEEFIYVQKAQQEASTSRQGSSQAT